MVNTLEYKILNILTDDIMEAQSIITIPPVVAHSLVLFYDQIFDTE